MPLLNYTTTVSVSRSVDAQGVTLYEKIAMNPELLLGDGHA